MNRRPRRRSVLPAFVVVLLAGSGAVAPGPARATRPVPRLTGETTFVSTEPAAARVRVERPVRLSARAYANPDVDLAAGPDFASLVLVKEPISQHSPRWIASRWPWCSADGCSAAKRTVIHTSNWRARDFDGTDLILPRGSYRVYAFSDEGGATATLRIDDVPGRSRIALTRPVPARMAATANRAVATDAAEATLMRDEQTLRSSGLYMFAAAVQAAPDNHGGYALTDCLVRPAAAPPDEQEPPGSCNAHDGVDAGGPGLLDEVWTYRSLAPGSYVASASYERVGTAKPPRSLDVGWAWLAFEE